MEVIKVDASLNHRLINDHIVATIGDFDGIHLAHQELFRKTLEIASSKSLKSAVITFDPHPNKIISRNSNYSNLLSLDDKIAIIKQWGFSYLIIISFDLILSRLSHEEFVKKILLNLGIQEVVVGFDFHYGYQGIGNQTTIYSDSKEKIIVNVIPKITINNQKIGSSYIKELLSKGKIKEVNNLLGYHFKITGQVIHGRNIGEKIQVPTANLALCTNYPKIKEGVYVVKCLINDQKYFAICNIGHNPSFNYYENLSYEIHIIEDSFSDNLYDKKITVEFIDYLREEKVFSSVSDFKRQIEQDKKRAINILNNAL